MISRGGRIDGNVLIRRGKAYACIKAQSDFLGSLCALIQTKKYLKLWRFL